VSGAKGKPRPETYKVSATYRDGFRAAGTLTMMGRNSVAKAGRCGELVLQRVREAGFELRDSVVECLGGGDGVGGVVRRLNDDQDSFGETVLRVAVDTDSRDAAERFARELMPFITAGPQGTTGYAEGRPRVHPVFRYWPCLIKRDAVESQVEIIVSEKSTGGASPFAVRKEAARSTATRLARSDRAPSRLYDIACARSGDKGTSANVGVIARSGDSWEFLRTWLTANRVAEFFAPLGIESVERFELPNLRALNFVLRGVLRRSLRTDAQGKALGQMLLEMRLPEDAMRMM
jgi:hypothetical protein